MQALRLFAIPDKALPFRDDDLTIRWHSPEILLRWLNSNQHRASSAVDFHARKNLPRILAERERG